MVGKDGKIFLWINYKASLLHCILTHGICGYIDNSVAHFDENGMIVSEQIFTIRESNGMYTPNDTQRSVTIVSVDAPTTTTTPAISLIGDFCGDSDDGYDENGDFTGVGDYNSDGAYGGMGNMGDMF